MVALFFCHRRERRGARQPRVTARSALRNGRTVETMSAEDPPTESPRAKSLHGDVLVAIATYNERDNIPRLFRLRALVKLLPHHRLPIGQMIAQQDGKYVVEKTRGRRDALVARRRFRRR